MSQTIAARSSQDSIPAKDSTALQVAVSQRIQVPGQIDDVFDFVAAEDVLPKILTGYGVVPGVAYTSDVSGPWDQPGSDRVVHLADGSLVKEGVTHHQRARYFAYRVSDPSFALKYLMIEARGQFWFEQRGPDVDVNWTYTFVARNRLAKLPLRLFVQTQWKGYMAVCMKNIMKHFATR